jgi:hypothetical protein
LSLELNYDVEVQASLDDIRKTAIIEGQAIDTSVNKNRWQVPSEDLDFFCETLKTATIRINHGDSTESVKGLVNKAKHIGEKVFFEAEVSSDPVLLTQIEKKYLRMVSPRVVSDNVVCSLCRGKTRDADMRVIHLCAGAWEIMHQPRCVELSIVADAAYENNIFHFKGFAAAMDESQRQGLIASICECADKSQCPCGLKELKAKLQPDLHGLNIQGEKNKMSASENQPPITPSAMPAPGEKLPKAGTELTYQQLEEELTKNTSQIMDACKAAIADNEKKLEAKIEATVKAAVEAAVPKPRPNGKGQTVPGIGAGAGLPGIDDAQRLNNMFASKGSLKKAGLELAAAAKRMGSLTADITHTEPEEEEQN